MAARSADAVARAAKVERVFLDVDGVLTDGTLQFDGEGRESKRFHTHDGHGIRMAQRAGLTFGLITGRESEIVTRRAAELQIDEVHQRVYDKGTRYLELREKLGFEDESAAYMGDDLIDLPVLTRVGFSGAPPEALPEVRERVHWVASRPAGAGAVRELLEFILKARGDWAGAVERYGLRG